MHYRTTGTLRAPIDRVFAFLIDPRNALALQPQGTTVTAEPSGPVGPGTVLRYHRPNRKGDFSWAVKEAESPRRIVFVVTLADAVPATMIHVLHEVNGTTVLESDSEFVIFRRLRFLDPVVFVLLYPCLWWQKRKGFRYAREVLEAGG